MEFFRQGVFSLFTWMVTTFALAVVSALMILPGLPKPKPSDATIECLRIEPNPATRNKETGFYTFTCIKEK